MIHIAKSSIAKLESNHEPEEIRVRLPELLHLDQLLQVTPNWFRDFKRIQRLVQILRVANLEGKVIIICDLELVRTHLVDHSGAHLRELMLLGLVLFDETLLLTSVLTLAGHER